MEGWLSRPLAPVGSEGFHRRPPARGAAGRPAPPLHRCTTARRLRSPRACRAIARCRCPWTSPCAPQRWPLAAGRPWMCLLPGLPTDRETRGWVSRGPRTLGPADGAEAKSAGQRVGLRDRVTGQGRRPLSAVLRWRVGACGRGGSTAWRTRRREDGNRTGAQRPAGAGRQTGSPRPRIHTDRVDWVPCRAYSRPTGSPRPASGRGQGRGVPRASREPGQGFLSRERRRGPRRLQPGTGSPGYDEAVSSHRRGQGHTPPRTPRRTRVGPRLRVDGLG